MTTTRQDSQITPVSARLLASDPDAFASALGDSFARHGFGIVADHGIPQATVAGALDVMRRFFALDPSVKARYRIPGGAGQRGYTPFGIEAAKGADLSDLKEFWHVGRDLPEGHPLRAIMPANVDVAEIPGFHAKAYALFDALDLLGITILTAIARYLKLAPDYFTPKVDHGNSILRLLHYPPVPAGAAAIRAGAHEDINVITLLLGAEEAGLELLGRDGVWRAIAPPEGAVVVNIGDMLQRLTNHVLPSTTHRVVNPAPERAGVPRYSMPFFLHFASDFPIATLPGCVTPDNPNRYPEPILADDYLRERLREIRLA